MKPKASSIPAEPSPELRASDVQKAAGLSYRQLNDWGSKGALPGQRAAEGQWRKFTPREVFALMVCAALRRQFGVSVDALKFIKSFMMQDGADHLLAAIRLMKRGLSVWLMTDCRTSFVMDNDLEFADLFEHGCFRRERQEGFMMLPINPIVKRLVALMKDPVDVSPVVDTYAEVASIRAEIFERSEHDLKVLNLIRDPTNEAVNLNLKDGSVVRATTKKRTVASPGREVTEEQVLRMLREERFQTVTLKKHDGKLVAMEQSIPIPLQQTERRQQQGRPSRTLRKNSDRLDGKQPRKTT